MSFGLWGCPVNAEHIDDTFPRQCVLKAIREMICFESDRSSISGIFVPGDVLLQVRDDGELNIYQPSEYPVGVHTTRQTRSRETVPGCTLIVLSSTCRPISPGARDVFMKHSLESRHLPNKNNADPLGEVILDICGIFTSYMTNRLSDTTSSIPLVGCAKFRPVVDADPKIGWRLIHDARR